MRWSLCVGALLLVGCKNDNKLAGLKFSAIAVATGDFDQVEADLTQLDIGYTPYEGYISQAVYDPSIKPDAMSLKTEDLFTRDQGTDPEIDLYDAVFVNSGTRGFGAYVYNGVETDDSLVTNQTVIDNVRNYVENGGTLVVSDWAYDLIEACWPDEIEFAGDDTVLDDAQRGTSTSTVATVQDQGLKDQLNGDPTVDITYDYSYWSVIESVAADATVYLTGDITYRKSDAEGDATLTSVPLLVGFQPTGGQVLFSTFHWRAQREEAAEAMLLGTITGLDPGSAETATSPVLSDDTGGGDTGASGTAEVSGE